MILVIGVFLFFFLQFVSDCIVSLHVFLAWCNKSGKTCLRFLAELNHTRPEWANFLNGRPPWLVKCDREG